WAIDYMEEGRNSSWLLPNRVYEASRYGAVPIALSGVQAGRFLAQHGLGVRLADAGGLGGALERLSPTDYTALRRQVAAAPREALVADDEDCRSLVRAIAGKDASLQEYRSPNKAKLVA